MLKLTLLEQSHYPESEFFLRFIAISALVENMDAVVEGKLG